MKNISLLFLLALMLICSKSTEIPDPKVNYCSDNNMTFANNSQYQINLNTILHSLYSNANNPTGYYQAVAGINSDDAVYGHFLCRGDQNATTCQDCLAKATSNDFANKYCSNRTRDLIWYDECMVRYSSESFFGTLYMDVWFPYLNPNNITGNVSDYIDHVGGMMNDLAIRAANGGEKKYATKSIKYTSWKVLYGLAQCTPDLSADNCYQCLSKAIERLGVGASVGSYVYMFSCQVRYENQPFFIGAANLSSSQLSPLPDFRPITGKKEFSAKVIVAIVASIVVVLGILLAIGILLFKRKSKKPVVDAGEEFTSFESLQYDLVTLESATNNFSDENKLGEGGFGGVYKGTLLNGQDIAVKRLSKSSNQGLQEFKNEVLLIAKLQHRNLVRLLGFCLEGLEKLLVYEYVPNKSLDYILFDPEKQGRLIWETRHKIIRGIARGMVYLHHDSQLKIIHRDLKSSNILLDKDMNPKIADFGTARIFGIDQTQASTSRVVGTYGYMAPEYVMHGKFSEKSDVYSFGVLVLEIVSGKKNGSCDGLGNATNLVAHAWRLWKEGTPLKFVDTATRDSCSSKEVMRCMHLALLCVQNFMEDRPTMTTILLALESDAITLPVVPEQPGLFLRDREKSTSDGSDLSSTKSQ